MVLLTMLHLCNGAANIKKMGNKILEPSIYCGHMIWLLANPLHFHNVP
jgi:hypothetical protein